MENNLYETKVNTLNNLGFAIVDFNDEKLVVTKHVAEKLHNLDGTYHIDDDLPFTGDTPKDEHYLSLPITDTMPITNWDKLESAIFIYLSSSKYLNENMDYTYDDVVDICTYNGDIVLSEQPTKAIVITGGKDISIVDIDKTEIEDIYKVYDVVKGALLKSNVLEIEASRDEYKYKQNVIKAIYEMRKNK